MTQRTCELCGIEFEVTKDRRRFCSLACGRKGGKRTSFWGRVAANPGGCWTWTGPINNKGYGRHGQAYAHRMAYEAFFGSIPNGLVIDHLCRNTVCVNPYHLEPVTYAENARRGIFSPPISAIAALNRAKTHCPQGHPYDDANTATWRGGRSCRACRNAGKRRRRRQQAT